VEPCESVTLYQDQAAEVLRLVEIVEDWLLHASSETVFELGEFLSGMAWGSAGQPWRRAEQLISDLGDVGVALRKAIPR
jgi:hypothetical protein